ncbi:MAG: amidohydrolase [Eubacteriales bacterium]|nr:amidohydrolase [Eubacteriales bacterium]
MSADICLTSRFVFTGRGEGTEPLSVLIQGERILAVVPRGEEGPYLDAHTQIMDLGDRMVMPGFVDAHTHFFLGAAASCEQVCSDPLYATSEQECVQMMLRYAGKHPEAKRLRGRGWQAARWTGGQLPTKDSLDAFFPDIPVYMQSDDVHCYWLNSRALEECGITKEDTVETGYIGKDDSGELNGILMEIEASVPADRIYHSFTRAEEEKMYRDLLAEAARCGVTSLSEMTSSEYDECHRARYRIVKEMEQKGELTARLHIFTKLFDCENYGAALALQRELDSPYLRISGLKGFVDGVVETYTGLLLEPYSDRPDTCGIGVPMCTQEELNAWITEANREGLPVRLHCIADGSVRMALNAFEASVKANGKKGLPNAIEHIEILHPDDIARFRELEVIPSMQPMHLLLDEDGEIERVGAHRVQYEWVMRTLLEETGRLAIGTDYPVVSLSPFDTIYAAVTRRHFDGREASRNPQEALTMAQTLRAYTYGAAQVYSRQDEIGSLEAGKYADLVVIDRDLFSVPYEQIRDCRVAMTMVGGRVVYESGIVK